MHPSKALPQVFIYRDPVDFRKSHRGPAAIVELELGHNQFAGHLYAFTNRQRNSISTATGPVPTTVAPWP